MNSVMIVVPQFTVDLRYTEEFHLAPQRKGVR
jgi:hypothetical protein